MLDTKEMKVLLEDLGRDFEEFKKANDQRLDTIEKGAGFAEVEEKVEKINASMDELVKERDKAMAEAKVLADRIDQLEATLDGADVLGGKSVRKDLLAYQDTFEKWMRSTVAFDGKQADPEITRELQKLAKEIPELKAIDTTVGATGGVAVPEVISRMINDQVRLVSPFRDMVKVVTVGTSDYKELVNIHGEASAWVGETGARSETATPQFRERAPTMGTLYAYPRATEESVDDVFFNVAQLLVDVTGDEFAIAEEDAFIRGNGTNKPTGILNTAPTTDTDTASPARSAEAIEYIPLDTSSPLSAIDPDQLITIVYRLRRPYRRRANWAMNSNTTGDVRKLKDSQGQYLWAPGLQAGQPDSLLGYNVRTLEGMDDATANLHPILFGDFMRAYVLVIRVGLRITVDNNITTPGYIKWYIRQRTGGILLDNNALKAGKYSTS